MDCGTENFNPYLHEIVNRGTEKNIFILCKRVRILSVVRYKVTWLEWSCLGLEIGNSSTCSVFLEFPKTWIPTYHDSQRTFKEFISAWAVYLKCLFLLLVPSPSWGWRQPLWMYRGLLRHVAESEEGQLFIFRLLISHFASTTIFFLLCVYLGEHTIAYLCLRIDCLLSCINQIRYSENTFPPSIKHGFLNLSELDS